MHDIPKHIAAKIENIKNQIDTLVK